MEKNSYTITPDHLAANLILVSPSKLYIACIFPKKIEIYGRCGEILFRLQDINLTNIFQFHLKKDIFGLVFLSGQIKIFEIEKPDTIRCINDVMLPPPVTSLDFHTNRMEVCASTSNEIHIWNFDLNIRHTLLTIRQETGEIRHIRFFGHYLLTGITNTNLSRDDEAFVKIKTDDDEVMIIAEIKSSRENEDIQVINETKKPPRYNEVCIYPDKKSTMQNENICRIPVEDMIVKSTVQNEDICSIAVEDMIVKPYDGPASLINKAKEKEDSIIAFSPRKLKKTKKLALKLVHTGKCIKIDESLISMHLNDAYKLLLYVFKKCTSQNQFHGIGREILPITKTHFGSNTAETFLSRIFYQLISKVKFPCSDKRLVGFYKKILKYLKLSCNRSRNKIFSIESGVTITEEYDEDPPLEPIPEPRSVSENYSVPPATITEYDFGDPLVEGLLEPGRSSENYSVSPEDLNNFSIPCCKIQCWEIGKYCNLNKVNENIIITKCIIYDKYSIATSEEKIAALLPGPENTHFVGVFGLQNYCVYFTNLLTHFPFGGVHFIAQEKFILLDILPYTAMSSKKIATHYINTTSDEASATMCEKMVVSEDQIFSTAESNTGCLFIIKKRTKNTDSDPLMILPTMKNT